MPVMTLIADVETTGFTAMRKPDFDPDAHLIHLQGVIEVGFLDHGMDSGKPSVALCFELPDGRVVLAETSMLLFLAAARFMESRYPDLMEQP